ncbi:MAG: hypothetical protein KAR11_01350 [Phycisphaerae bacterium]|nr:hypothetical protein [Phycisphaerae bacterium]
MKVQRNTLVLVGIVFLLGLVATPLPVVWGKVVKGKDTRKAVKKTAGAKKKAAPVTKADKATEVYNAAVKVYRLGRWGEASKGLAGFIRDHKTNENISLAHLQLAHCYQLLGNDKGRIEQLEIVIKKFPGSKAANFAWGNRLVTTLRKGKYDQFISFYAKVAKAWKTAPLAVSGRIDWRKVGSYYWSFNKTYLIWPYRRTSGYNLSFNSDMQWAGKVLAAGDNQDRAAKMLRIFDPVFRKYGQSLPSEWKFAHVQLLRKSGLKKAKTALTQYKKYAKGWSKNDPRAIGFMLMEAQWCQGREPLDLRGDSANSKEASKSMVINYNKRADEIYDALRKNFAGYTSLDGVMVKRLKFLLNQTRNDEFFELASWYLDKYPYGAHRDKVLSLWTDASSSLPVAQQARRLQKVLKFLEDETSHYPHNPLKMGANIINRIDVLLVLGDADSSTKLSQKLLSKPYWCAGNFDKIVQLSQAHSHLQVVVDAARKQYNIPVADPDGKAAKLYNEFQARLSDNKVRHMEEIVEDMYNQHRNDAYTILAISEIVDYFYKKVLHDKRDKWVNIMLKAYPYNPLTETVLNLQINSTHGSKVFDRLRIFANAAMSHFPGSTSAPRWFSYRVKCFDGLKNKSAGNTEYMRQKMNYVCGQLNKRVQSGEIAAIVLLGTYYTDLKSGKTYTEKCAYWLGVGENWKNKYQGVVCSDKAFYYAYRLPTIHWHWNKVDFVGAAKAAVLLRKQTHNPELKWKMEFEDINMYIQSKTPEGAQKGLVELRKRLKSGRYPKISDRLDLPNLGLAIGQHKLMSQGRRIVPKLKKFCKSRGANAAYCLLLANMNRYGGNFSKAGSMFLKAGTVMQRPIDRWSYHQNAVVCYWSVSREKYSAVQKKYIGKLSTAPYAASRLYYEWGSRFWSDTRTSAPRRIARGIWMKLKAKYPESSFWGNAQKIMSK